MNIWQSEKLDAPTRILMFLATRDAPVGGNEYTVQELATLLGLTYPSTSNALTRLKKRGIVARQHGVFVLLP